MSGATKLGWLLSFNLEDRENGPAASSVWERRGPWHLPAAKTARHGRNLSLGPHLMETGNGKHMGEPSWEERNVGTVYLSGAALVDW